MLYHAEVYLPDNIKSMLPHGPKSVVHTQHAKDAARHDRYGYVSLPDVIDFDSLNIFEVEICGKTLCKVVGRKSLDNLHDICYVIGIDGRRHFIKTVWLNLKTDKHRTLNRSKYVTS